MLRWLEENHVPIDYIAATGTGSLIGGLYAAGYSVSEIESFLQSLDWQEVLRYESPFRQQAFRRKEDGRALFNDVQLGLRKGIRLAAYVSKGNSLGLALSRFTAPYEGMSSFDSLPTPFWSVATDLVSGEKVFLKKGSLFEAIRASMASPGLFDPIPADGKLLADGSLVDNIPIDALLAMGADFTIAVAPQKVPWQSENPGVLAVSSRSIGIMIAAGDLNSLNQADVVILPELRGLASSDYSRFSEIERSGYEAARTKLKTLSRYYLEEDTWRGYVQARQKERRPSRITPQIIDPVGNLASGAKKAIVRAIPTGQPLDIAALENELEKVVGLGRYETARYSFFQQGDNEGLRIHVKEKDSGPPFLNLGVFVDTLRKGRYGIAFGGRLTLLDAGGPASELRVDFSNGQIRQIGTEYYYRFGGGPWFVAPRVFYGEENRPLFEQGDRDNDFQTHSGGGAADVGYAFNRFDEFRIGYSVTQSRIAVWDGSTAFTPFTGRTSGFHVRFVHEGQNYAVIPTEGTRALVTGSWMLSYPHVGRQFAVVESVVGYARSWRDQDRWVLYTTAAGGAAPDEAGLNTRFTLGGTDRLAALGSGRVFGDRYYYGGAYLMRRLDVPALTAVGRFYLASNFEAGKAWNPGQSAAPRYSASGGLLGATPFGAVFFGGGVGDRGDHRLFFKLGRIF